MEYCRNSMVGGGREGGGRRMGRWVDGWMEGEGEWEEGGKEGWRVSRWRVGVERGYSWVGGGGR